MNYIEEKIEALENEGSNFYEVATIFEEYFGEEFVDTVSNSLDSVKTLLSISTIEVLLGRYCLVESIGDNEVKISRGILNCVMDNDLYNEIKVKDLSYIPDVLKPIIDKIFTDVLVSNGNFIIIKFPKVTVTNENNKFIHIQDLYVRVCVTFNGYMDGKFEMIRSYYPLEQWNSDYCHSHISHISTEWMVPCTGSGPINSTINFLGSYFDKEKWGLFCYELDKFVTVESIAGIPYRRLESVGLMNDRPFSNPVVVGKLKFNGKIIGRDMVQDFVKRVVKDADFKISFVHNSFELGETFDSFWIKVSKIFTKWYNEKYKEGKVKGTLRQLLNKEIVDRYIIKDGKVYGMRRMNVRSTEDYQGAALFKFKGEWIHMEIGTTSPELNMNCTYLVSPVFVSKLIHYILLLLNYNYGRETTTAKEEGKIKNEGRTVYL